MSNRLRDALRRIERWFGEFPPTGRYWDEPENTRPMSYGAAYGSNGERDFMRQIARDALAHRDTIKEPYGWVVRDHRLPFIATFVATKVARDRAIRQGCSVTPVWSSPVGGYDAG